MHDTDGPWMSLVMYTHRKERGAAAAKINGFVPRVDEVSANHAVRPHLKRMVSFPKGLPAALGSKPTVNPDDWVCTPVQWS